MVLVTLASMSIARLTLDTGSGGARLSSNCINGTNGNLFVDGMTGCVAPGAGVYLSTGTSLKMYNADILTTTTASCFNAEFGSAVILGTGVVCTALSSYGAIQVSWGSVLYGDTVSVNATIPLRLSYASAGMLTYPTLQATNTLVQVEMASMAYVSDLTHTGPPVAYYCWRVQYTSMIQVNGGACKSNLTGMQVSYGSGGLLANIVCRRVGGV